jgi:hypothetical protein
MSKSSLFLVRGLADGTGLLVVSTTVRTGVPSWRKARAARERKIATKSSARRNWYFPCVHV